MYHKIKKEIKKYSSKERKEINQRFFKTEKGEYGEGDIFVGVRVPDLRKITKQFSAKIFEQIQKNNFSILEKLASSKIHEERLLAVIFLVNFYKKSDELKIKKIILKFYLKHKKFLNNWDIIDISVHYILGQAILDGVEKKEILEKLAHSKNFWERRMAIVATFVFIRRGEFEESLKISKILLVNEEEDLIHKAVGWMLREVWKKNKEGAQKCEAFLRSNYHQIPRTTLRYSIEKMPEKKRQRFLKGKFN